MTSPIKIESKKKVGIFRDGIYKNREPSALYPEQYFCRFFSGNFLNPEKHFIPHIFLSDEASLTTLTPLSRTAAYSD
ncbi:hypothetical protein JT26_02240 [Porphyromonas sp. COT-108 OH1349]|nr:hypothetical protein JT26_02240 [Porphyromonas sp. COT-108 OH1349]